MNKHQLSALGRSRHLIANKLPWNDSTIEELFQRRLLTKSMAVELQPAKDTSNFNKVIRFLDLLEENSKSLGSNVFERFLQFLGEHPVTGGVCSIADQLRTELQAVLGKLPIESYIEFEVSKLVEIEFSGPNRTSSERNDFIAHISARLQVSKEIWKRDIAETEDRLAKLRDQNAQTEHKRLVLFGRILLFLHVNRAQIPKRFRKDEIQLQQQNQREVEEDAALEEPEPENRPLVPTSSLLTQAVRLLVNLTSSGIEQRQANIDSYRKGVYVLLTRMEGNRNVSSTAENVATFPAADEVIDEPPIHRDFRKGLLRSKALLDEFERNDQMLEGEHCKLEHELEKATRAADRVAQQIAAVRKRHLNELKLADERIAELEGRLNEKTQRVTQLRNVLHQRGADIQGTRLDIEHNLALSKALELTRTVGYVLPLAKPLVAADDKIGRPKSTGGASIKRSATARVPPKEVQNASSGAKQ